MSAGQPTAVTSQQGVHYEPMLLLVTAFATGIWLDHIYPLALPLWCLLCIASLVAWCCAWRGARNMLGSFCILLALVMLGGAWHHYQWHLITNDHLAARVREAPQPICLEGVVLQAPRIIPAPPTTPLRPFPIGDRSRCELQIESIRHGESWQQASGKTRLMVDGHLLGVRVGDVVRVFAQYQAPTPQLNPGEFDFANFQRAEQCYVQLSCELPQCVLTLPQERRQLWTSWLDQIRSGGSQLLRRYLSPARAPLAVAVMLGEREYLDTERNERFLVTGTVHLLAISGLNLAILVYVFWMLGHLGWLSRRGTLFAAIVFALGYAVLTDAEPPVLRASILITVFCLARWHGRPISPWNVLAIAALVVLAINPASLFHIGAQLSFLAVAVLVWFRDWFVIREPVDPLDRLIARTRPWWQKGLRYTGQLFWQVTLSGCLVWFYSLPLVWLHYHLISPIGVGLNPLVALPMAIALFSGFTLLCLGWLVPLVGTIAGGVCDFSLHVMEAVIGWSIPLPGGFLWLPAPPTLLIIAFYALVLLAAYLALHQWKRGWFIAAAALWFAFAWQWAMPVPSATSRDTLTASFVSIGHGTAVLLELPGGRTLLYDCGRLGSPLSGARPISAVLWSRGITHLDGVLISHADSDHYNALPDLLERFSVGQVYVSTVMWERMSPGLKRLRDEIEAHRVPIVELRAGDTLQSPAPNVRLSILHPPRGGVLGSDNANSLVLLVEHAARRLLLAGDLEERGLNDLLAEEPIACDVVLAPHHGSTRSNPTGFALWCRPQFVVISGQREFEPGRDSHQVEHAFLARGAQVFHTSTHGCIQFQISREDIIFHPHRKPKEEK